MVVVRTGSSENFGPRAGGPIRGSTPALHVTWASSIFAAADFEALEQRSVLAGAAHRSLSSGSGSASQTAQAGGRAARPDVSSSASRPRILPCHPIPHRHHQPVGIICRARIEMARQSLHWERYWQAGWQRNAALAPTHRRIEQRARLDARGMECWRR